MNRQLEEHNEFNYSTDAEWDKEDARIRGEQNQDSPWVLSDRDVWHVNPYWGKYDDNGQPLMKDGTRCRHPEDYDEPMDEETTKLWQVRTNLQLLYGNSDFEYFEPLIKNTLDILDGLIEDKTNK